MKKSMYLWAIRQLGFEDGEYLTVESIEDAYENLGDYEDKNYLKAKNFLIANIDEINEFNNYDYEDDEEDEEFDEDYDRYQYRRKRINTLIIFLIFIFIGIFSFVILRNNDLFVNNQKYLSYQLYGDSYTVSLNSDFKGESITIPKSYDDISITRIGEFTSNTLKEVKIDANITIINDYAFKNCTKLETINIPSSVEKIGEGAFSNCLALKSIFISGNVTEIKDSTFLNCIELENVYLPNSVNIIGANAFDGCIRLKYFEMPTNIIEIHDYAFANCELINNISFGGKLYSIGNEAFKNCKSLNGVLIPASINYLGDFVFKCCDNLKNFEIESNNELAYVGENILYDTYLYSTFKDNIFITGNWIIFTKGDIGSVTINNNVSKKAFYDTAYTVISLVIENGVSYILEEAFYGINIEDITLPSSIRGIGYKAFYGNTKLIYLKLEFNDPYYIDQKSIWKCFGFSSQNGNDSLNTNLKIYVGSSYLDLFKEELLDNTSVGFIRNCIFAY